MNNFPKTIGVTGGIGSGKSYICQVLATMGYPVFFADKEAKDLLITDLSLRSQIIKIFGPAAYNTNGLNRKFLSERIFENKSLLNQMNAIVHPAVRNTFDKWVNSHKNKSFVFQEAAILFETGGYKSLDKNVLVIADESVRIERVIKRDNIAESDVLKRIENQMKDSDKIKLADFVISNNPGEMIIPQLQKMFKELFNETI